MASDTRHPLLADTSTLVAVGNADCWDVQIGLLAHPVAFLRMGTNTNW